MTETLLLLNSWIGLGALLLEVSVVVGLFFLIYYFRSDQESRKGMNDFLQYFIENYSNFFKKFKINFPNTLDEIEQLTLIKIFILAFFSSVMTLVYSEYFGLVPCALCWFERIFMYGITIISFIAIISKSKDEKKIILKYLGVYSVLGALVSLYHHVLQMTAGLESHLPCPVSGGDCAKRVIFEYGHITFPWLAFVVFVSFVLAIWFVRIYRK
jgi:disulfide bond formation protein DsbB